MSQFRRNYATLREIQLRLRSVQSIAKITQSMKMIASTKLTRAQRAMEVARVYGATSTNLFSQAETGESENNNSTSVIITASSDRGLCGGIHSSVSKATKALVKEHPEIKVVVVGDKAKIQLQRTLKDNIELSFNQIGRTVPTFAEACAVSEQIDESNLNFDRGEIIYNKFRSVIAYEPTLQSIFSEEAFKRSNKFAQYEVEDDVLANLKEFTQANALYWALVEGHASEMAAKRTAMENATKNAGEMIQSLTMAYNRGRQAVITNELIDIITGASAI